MASGKANKARMAKRVIEVLDFFDEEHPQATVMEIARRFNRPQSSTSELLSNLQSLGLLHKDRYTRAYSLTPRAAMLGASVQPSMVRDGRLARLMDRLSSQTGLSVALFGLVGLTAQIYAWRPGNSGVVTSIPGGLRSGLQEHLYRSAAGWLLLSTLEPQTCSGMLRRMNAEASPEAKFDVADVAERVRQAAEQGAVRGFAGFGAAAEMTVMLLPGLPSDQPLAVGLLHDGSDQVDGHALQDAIRDAIAFTDEAPRPAPVTGGSVQPLFHAA
ncbi:helix-turn-helix domain-containing protein [Stakelama tenebrarum]|uniref:Helix-turn-helix domain-containing protein n=1 Tax=Stakelama tenebrarum TaxID=2711215 RepID=A0A6G6Y7A3_9SPHN|nr:helix-turn-helix domain-containing protein [Sphingosinithalassobacter tenebrarum]QIG80822.1 helix-turn-helix domain-containing protein [Sphingosinithalassobacter tenebrarum]